MDYSPNNIVLPSMAHMVPHHLYTTNNSTEDSTGFPIKKQGQSASAFLSPRDLTNANAVHTNQDFVKHKYYHEYKNTNPNSSSSLNHSQSLNYSPTQNLHQQDSHPSTFSTAALFQHNNYFATHPNASFSSNTSSGSSSSSNGTNAAPRVITGGNIIIGESSSSNSNSSNSISSNSASNLDTKSSSSGHTKNTANQVTNEGPWSEEEHAKFLQGLQEMGRNWTKIAKDYVKSRVRTQVASHAQKYFKKMNKGSTPSDKLEQDTVPE